MQSSTAKPMSASTRALRPSDGINIFEFDSHVDFLVAVADAHQRGVRRMTLDQWAVRLGYRSPRSIAMVLKGQRLPSLALIVAIGRDLKLSRTEQRYLELLVQLAKHKRTSLPTDEICASIRRLIPSGNVRTTITFDAFAYISEWHHIVLKQLIASPDFVEDLDELSKRLHRKISPTKVRDAIATLIRLNMVRRDTSSGRLSVTSESLQTRPDISSSAVRRHHKEMIDRAKEALEEQPVLKREFATATFRAHPDVIPEIKLRIRHFLDRIDEEFGSAVGTEVFQTNVQFFAHTAKPEI